MSTGILRLMLQVAAVHRLIDDQGNTTAENVTMSAVIKDGGANGGWTTSTPSAHVQFIVNNPAAFGQFRPKQIYNADLSLTQPAAPAPAAAAS